MLRVAANRLESFPKELLEHQHLSWVAVGSNPFTEAAMHKRLQQAPATIDFKEVLLGEKLGSGAGATVYAAEWRGSRVAAKIWEADRFSDGTANGEWGANRVASEPGSSSLVRVLGTFEEPKKGMILELLDGSTAAAGPPNFETVTRDTLPSNGGKGPRLSPSAALYIARNVAAACHYLHSTGIIHGDVYLHNTLIVMQEGSSSSRRDVIDARLSDFGAAAIVEGSIGEGLKRLEVRSFGWLLQDLLDILSDTDNHNNAIIARLRDLRELCSSTDVYQLPSFATLSEELAKEELSSL